MAKKKSKLAKRAAELEAAIIGGVSSVLGGKKAPAKKKRKAKKAKVVKTAKKTAKKARSRPRRL